MSCVECMLNSSKHRGTKRTGLQSWFAVEGERGIHTKWILELLPLMLPTLRGRLESQAADSEAALEEQELWTESDIDDDDQADGDVPRTTPPPTSDAGTHQPWQGYGNCEHAEQQSAQASHQISHAHTHTHTHALARTHMHTHTHTHTPARTRTYALVDDAGDEGAGAETATPPPFWMRGTCSCDTEGVPVATRALLQRMHLHLHTRNTHTRPHL